MKKKVIIVGGGFGGLNAAKELAAHAEQFEVTLLDQRNHHLFQPLLYQVATAALSPADIATPIRDVLSDAKNVTVLLSKVDAVDLSAKTVHTDVGPMTYDYLVLACGASHSYFGKNEWEEFAPGLKTIEMATEIRRRILTAFELAELQLDEAARRPYLNFVVVGGGPTGVEMAGAIAEIAQKTLNEDFRHLRSEDANVILVEAGERVLAAFHPELSRSSRADLEKLGVRVLTQARVTSIDANGVTFSKDNSDNRIDTKTVVWGAGVQASSLGKSLGVPLDRTGRVIVNPDLSIPGFAEAFVIGDQASFKTSETGTLPGLAPVAIQQGKHVTKNIRALAHSNPTAQFRYLDKGQMATIGRKLAVMEFKGIRQSGFIAWIAWLFIHIFYLIGFRNRFVVLFQWAWSYVTFTRGSRLITNRGWK